MFNIVKILRGSWLRKVVDEAEQYSGQLLEQNVAANSVQKTVNGGDEEAAKDEFFDAAQDQVDSSGFGTGSTYFGGTKSLWKGNFDSRSVIFDPNSNEDLVRKVELLQKQMAEMQRKIK